MTENLNPEVRDTTLERQKEVEATIKDWSRLSEKEITERIRHLNFFVDNWGLLSEYNDLQLEGGYTLITTSISPDKPGTIMVSHTDPDRQRRINNVMKSYISNHGLTLAQADTLLKTLYYAKFKLLPLLVTVLNDKNLYNAYRTYSREMSRKEYIQWVCKYNLQNSDFNVTLLNGERAQLSDLLKRMARADKLLQPDRARWRAQAAAREQAATEVKVEA